MPTSAMLTSNYHFPLLMSKSKTRFTSTYGSDEETQPKFWALVRPIYLIIPRKPLLYFALVACVLSGAMMAVFSYLLSRLLFEVSIGVQNVSIINTFSSLVLGVATVDGSSLVSNISSWKHVGCCGAPISVNPLSVAFLGQTRSGSINPSIHQQGSSRF